MAAFTAALIGLGLAGGLLGGKALASRKATGEQDTDDESHSPHSKLGEAPDQPPVAPPSLSLTSSSAATAAGTAAARARRRATAGTMLSGPKSGQAPAKPKLQPKSLLGY